MFIFIELQVRVFDGNFCQTKEEALAKFKEKQIKEAMSQSIGNFY